MNNHYLKNNRCLECGMLISDDAKRCLHHANKCKNNPGYRKIGSKHIGISGYVMIKIKDPNIWMTEHRYIVEQYIGRKLTKKEEVHHIDNNRQNNKLKNLYVFPNKVSHKCFETLIRLNIINKYILKSNLKSLKLELLK